MGRLGAQFLDIVHSNSLPFLTENLLLKLLCHQRQIQDIRHPITVNISFSRTEAPRHQNQIQDVHQPIPVPINNYP